MARRLISNSDMLSLICSSCRYKSPFLTQVRYSSARKNRKSEHIIVQLLQDVPRYGPSGSFIPVPNGTMRNVFYPRRQARYVIGPELKALRKSEKKIERDTTFQIHEEVEPVEPIITMNPLDDVELHRMTISTIEPRRAFGLLQALLPPTLVIHRQVNEAASDQNNESAPVPIFGSVGPLDIQIAIKNLISYNDEAATIPLTEDMITLEGVEEKKIKHLGTYQITITISPELVLNKRLNVRNVPAAPVSSNSENQFENRIQ